MAEYHSCYNCIYFGDDMDERGNPKCRFKEANPKEFIITSQPTVAITNSCKHFIHRWTAIRMIDDYTQLKVNIGKVKFHIQQKHDSYNSRWSLIEKAIRETCKYCLKIIDAYLGEDNAT